MARRCSRTACSGPAMATLTYVYAEQTAVLGPLATYAEPHTYDLCAPHAARLSAPRGWDTVRLVDGSDGSDGSDTAAGGEDDLLAVADAVSKNGRVQGRVPARPPSALVHPPTHSSARPAAPGPLAAGPSEGSGTVETGRRGHLRVLRDR